VCLHLASGRSFAPDIYALDPLLPALSIVLSALARQGAHDDAARAHTAFGTACGRLFARGERLEMAPPERSRAVDLEAALRQLARANPGLKRRIITACAWCVSADGAVNAREAELLRAISATFGCPLPPFLEGIPNALAEARLVKAPA
jgi:hypothetical protein